MSINEINNRILEIKRGINQSINNYSNNTINKKEHLINEVNLLEELVSLGLKAAKFYKNDGKTEIAYSYYATTRIVQGKLIDRKRKLKQI